MVIHINYEKNSYY